MKELEDTDPMPFGAYKGKPMQDVPASYMHYLWTHGLSDAKKLVGEGRLRVNDYMVRNMAHLKREHPDGIWT